MKVHDDWSAPGFDRPALAAAVGPFPHREMLRAWWETRGKGELELVENDEALLPLHRNAATIRFAGEADLFDYHSPLGTGAAALIADWAADLEDGVSIELDSLPAEAADEIMTGLEKAGLAPTAEMHESAAILELPDDFEAYLMALDKKQRHETRRKERRFAEALGTPRLHRESGPEAVATFAAMHRRAAGDKGSFMTADMADYFEALHTAVGASIDMLYGDSDEPVAAAFGFEDDRCYYLYNSAYEPAAGAASPGIVLVSEMIKQAIGSGRTRFDFLKGDEVYKYRLGAVARPLWRVMATTGGRS